MVTILVGPQGSGKSTWALNHSAPNSVIISQDTMGPKGHLDAFKRALKGGNPTEDSIIIDRINHTREQRARYVDLAREAGWPTEIVVMNRPFSTCLDRMMDRKGHPTIHNRETAIQALRTYFTQYERPAANEADSLTFLTNYDPFMLDLNNMYPADTRFIVIGDVHGCYDELMELLKAADYKQGEDVVVFCGDLIDRGPKIDKVLHFAMTTPRVHSVMGNHEWKLARHIASLGAGMVSKVKIGHGLQETIDQNEKMLDDPQGFDYLLGFLWSLPLVIKFGRNYVFHAGINPRYSMSRQNRDFLLFARKYNAEMNTHDDNENSPNWYNHKLHSSLAGHVLMFGHDVHIKETKVFAEIEGTDRACCVIPVDGGCVFGESMRGVIVNPYGTFEIISVPSKQPKEEHEPMYTHWSQPYEERVKAGFLSKSETDDLVLYNYTDKCTYEKKWDKYTLECRGLIFEKATGNVVARPFPKFFNVGETENTQLHNLPKEDYSCFEKMDGSLGIIFCYKGKWHVATRGSFHSEQAKQAAEILKQYDLDTMGHKVGVNVTLLAEIIYPENRVNPGARLVVDYGSTRMLVLLGAYCSTTGVEFPHEDLLRYARDTRMPIAQKFDYTIEQMIELQKTLPADKEGFVVRFESGLRVKIKGHEYLKMNKILNSITPLNIWDMMLESKDFVVPSEYLVQVPEEYVDEVLNIVFKLKEKKRQIALEVMKDFELATAETGINPLLPTAPETKKAMGLFLTQGTGRSKLKHPSAMFTILNGKSDMLETYCRKLVRPTSNQL